MKLLRQFVNWLLAPVKYDDVLLSGAILGGGVAVIFGFVFYVWLGYFNIIETLIMMSVGFAAVFGWFAWPWKL